MKSMWPPHFAAGEPPTKKGRPHNGIRPSYIFFLTSSIRPSTSSLLHLPAAGMPQLLRAQTEVAAAENEIKVIVC